jgi:hypothetical protein
MQLHIYKIFITHFGVLHVLCNSDIKIKRHEQRTGILHYRTDFITLITLFNLIFYRLR